jgi:hypothetical protein
MNRTLYFLAGWWSAEDEMLAPSAAFALVLRWRFVLHLAMRELFWHVSYAVLETQRGIRTLGLGTSDAVAIGRKRFVA